MIDLSVLIPVFNEVDNVEPLHAELDAVLRPLALRYEIIFVDDGSTDGSSARLRSIQERDTEHVRVIFLRRNCGQTAALTAALDQRGRDSGSDRRGPSERSGGYSPAARAARRRL